jgi:hypothetical protein
MAKRRKFSYDIPMYQRKSRLSVRQRNRLVEHFVAGTTARTAVELVGVNRNAVVSFYNRRRTIIAEGIVNLSQIWFRRWVVPVPLSLTNNGLCPAKLGVQGRICGKLTIPFTHTHSV